MKLSEILLFITMLFLGFAWLKASAEKDGQECKMESLKRENKILNSHRLTHSDTLEILYWSVTQDVKHKAKK
jgi:hypothetical protein